MTQCSWHRSATRWLSAGLILCRGCAYRRPTCCVVLSSVACVCFFCAWNINPGPIMWLPLFSYLPAVADVEISEAIYHSILIENNSSCRRDLIWGLWSCIYLSCMSLLWEIRARRLVTFGKNFSCCQLKGAICKKWPSDVFILQTNRGQPSSVKYK